MEQLSPNLRILKSPFGGSSSPVIRYFGEHRTVNPSMEQSRRKLEAFGLYVANS